MHQFYAFPPKKVQNRSENFRNISILVTSCHAILGQNQTNIQPVVTPPFVKQFEIDKEQKDAEFDAL